MVKWLNRILETGNWELGTVAATVSRYDPVGAVSTRKLVAFIRVRFPSDSAGLVGAKHFPNK